jgi:hypothetical protein
MPTTVIVIPQFTGAFMIPADFPAGGTLQVECVGASGGGATSGGGAYSKTNAITGITAGQTVYIQTGIPGFSTVIDTWFNKTTNAAPSSTTNGCLAKTGTAGGTSFPAGGQASAGVGDVKYSGGTGGDYYYDSESSSVGNGGGGGAAGPNGNGANAYNTGYNSGGGGANGGSASVAGGAGGNGRGGSGGGAFSSAGTAGNGTNGGGGGGTNTGTSGNGGPDLIWTDFAGVQWGPCGGGGGNLNAGGGYGGGACRLSDVGTRNSLFGIVVLTYTTGTATSSFVDAVPGATLWPSSINTTILGAYGNMKTPYQALGYYYIPYGVTSIKVETIGSAVSRASSSISFSPDNSPAPGGGAYASRTLTVTPGGALYLGVNGNPSGLFGTTEVDTWVNTTNAKPTVDSSSVVLAKGVLYNSYTGGSAASSFGSVKYSGGNTGLTGGSFTTQGGAGASAGPTGAGANGGDGASGSSGCGGGGGTNGGSAGAAGSSNNGGNGGNNRLGAGGGTGANSATSSAGANGTNGGGGGGGGYDPSGDGTDLSPGLGSLDSIWTTTDGRVYGPTSGTGGAQNLRSGVGWNQTSVMGYGAFSGILPSLRTTGTTYYYPQYNGVGLIVFSYTYVPTAGGNFLQFF